MSGMMASSAAGNPASDGPLGDLFDTPERRTVHRLETHDPVEALFGVHEASSTFEPEAFVSQGWLSEQARFLGLTSAQTLPILCEPGWYCLTHESWLVGAPCLR